MAETSIQWTDYSWNPIRCRDTRTSKVGHYCELVSPGCTNCYASTFQRRFGLPLYTGPAHREERFEHLQVFLDEKVLLEPLRWRKPRRVFVCSMTDLFGYWVPDAWLNRIFAVMAMARQHTFQVLTKRPERLAQYLNMVSDERDMQRWISAGEELTGERSHFDPPLEWPLPNVWLGTSVEDAARKSRIDVLRQTPAAVRFLSCEPLLEDLGTLDLTSISWVIAGGESGPGARPCNIAWIRSLVQQCQVAHVACFVKQLGANYADPANGVCGQSTLWPLDILPSGPTSRLKDRAGGDPDEWPQDLRVREFPR